MDEFQAQPGAGVTARLGADVIVVGTRRLLEEQGIELPADVAQRLEQLDASGQTSLFVARNGLVLGILGARDRVRPEAVVVLNELRNLGIDRIALLTGDRAAAAQAIAASLGISEVHAELLPAEKAEFLTRWQTPHPQPLSPAGRASDRPRKSPWSATASTISGLGTRECRPGH